MVSNKIRVNGREKAGLINSATAFLSLSFLLLSAWLPASAQPTVSAALSDTEMLIGDQVTLTVIASYSPPTELKNIGYDVLNREPRLEVLQAERFEKEGENGLRIAEVEIKLTSFDSGYYFIPPIPIAFEHNGRQDTIRTNQLALTVRTLPVQGDSLQIQPIKGVIEEPVNFRDILPYAIGGALFVLLAGGLFFYFWRRKRPLPPPPPPRRAPAHVLAREQLEALGKQKLWQKGQVKEYHSELTRILREYLERRYRIKALERTTDEILRGLDTVSSAADFDKGQLQELLRTVDLVKFAKAEPPASFHDEAMKNVETFIEQTKDETVEVEVPEDKDRSES